MSLAGQVRVIAGEWNVYPCLLQDRWVIVGEWSVYPVSLERQVRVIVGEWSVYPVSLEGQVRVIVGEWSVYPVSLEGQVRVIVGEWSVYPGSLEGERLTYKAVGESDEEHAGSQGSGGHGSCGQASSSQHYSPSPEPRQQRMRHQDVCRWMCGSVAGTTVTSCRKRHYVQHKTNCLY